MRKSKSGLPHATTNPDPLPSIVRGTPLLPYVRPRKIPRLAPALCGEVVSFMKEISTYTDPQEMVNAYGGKMESFITANGFLSLSRRNLTYPQYRITRSSAWKDDIDPWKNRDKLPLLSGGLVAELIYSDKPHVIRSLDVPKDDPAYEYLAPYKGAVVIPHFDKGAGLNMVMHLYSNPDEMNTDDLPEMVWVSNLFGRGVNALALRANLKEAYDSLDRELSAVAEIQRSLLPSTLPEIPTLKLAAHYQTSRRAGGDYYDFFPLEDGQWGIFIADVSGHGTPAAVVMAITHSLAHSHPGPHTPPGNMLSYLNQKLCDYPVGDGTFVTAFYGVYNPRTRTLDYSSAGHPAPRLRPDRSYDIVPLDQARTVPWGIDPEAHFDRASHTFSPGDLLLLYTDGITESFSPTGEMFTTDRLDQVLRSSPNEPQVIINSVRAAVDMFTHPNRAEDDRTLLAIRVT